MRKETVTAIIESLKGISDNVNNIIAILQNENVDEEVAVAKDAPSERTKAEVKKAPAKKVEPAKEEAEGKAVGQLNLDDMTYNELKKFAKDNGLSAVGDRKTLIKRIEENLLNKSAEVEEETEEVEEEVPVKKAAPMKAKKAPVKKAEPVEEVEEEPEVEEAEEEVEDDEEELISSIEEALEEMTDEEIKDLLVENGIKAKGKRQALIDAVIRGVKEGKIEFADEDEESEEAEEETEVEETEAEEVEAKEMTEERVKGINEYRSQVEEALSAGGMTKADLIAYIEAFRGETDKSLAKKPEHVLVDMYMECAENYIDDEGEMHDNEEPYMINEEPFCCGSPLNYNEKEKVYVCEHCGGEYEAE